MKLPIIETKRLRLKRLTVADNAAFFNYRSDAIANCLQGWIPKTLEDTRVFIERNADDFNKPNSWFQFAILEKYSNTLIGDIGIHFIGDDGMQCEIGFTIQSASQGKGYAVEAVESIIDFLFKNLDKHRITASIDPRNQASIALMKKLGFRMEAHHIKSYYSKGEWLDDLVFALLKEEWNRHLSNP